MNGEGSEISVAGSQVVLSNLAKWTCRIAEEVKDFEKTFSETLLSQSEFSTETAKSIQRIDFIRQAVEDTSTILREMSQDVCIDQEKIRKSLSLQDSKDLLSLNDRSCEIPDNPEPSDSITFF